ncbi:A/G-specific adenine glycosylase [Schaalia sp. ZJ1691]|uniref:A/G-specific adenine glycosylase n=1 Tax=Schaalia sp. ZJ1691 TaxID=2709404 RepID=UPI0013EAF877|nr:A/G-specific adenine glycosylase [Schaalia sp. ZJ1691]
MRRDDVSPWGSVVFEVMSQQTPIPRVQPIWERWMMLWPTPADLAAADTSAVLVEWKTLGYPSRALRLKECAAAISARPGGQVPADIEALMSLPGIGPYTASAVASFQFHARVPVLDTNVRRVFARVLDGQEFASRGAPTKGEIARATHFLPEDGAACARWNVAIMEFGAITCTQRRPHCDSCPIRSACQWAHLGFPRAETRPKGQEWKGTDRQARGRVLAALRLLHEDGQAHPSMTQAEALTAATLPGAPPDQAARVVDGLVRDGLLRHDPETLRYSLP